MRRRGGGSAGAIRAHLEIAICDFKFEVPIWKLSLGVKPALDSCLSLARRLLLSPRAKADGLPGPFRGSHELANRLEEGPNMLIVALNLPL